MDELVQMLSDSEHNAEVLHSNDASEVKEQVDRKWINMKFTNIGTSITFQLDEARSDYASGDYDNGEGQVKFVGKHTLNYEPVWVMMDFDLSTLEGKAHLEKRDIALDPTEAEKEAAEKKAGATQQTSSTQNESALTTTPTQSKENSAESKTKTKKKPTTAKSKSTKSKTKKETAPKKKAQKKTTKKATTAKSKLTKSKTNKETADA